MGKRIIDLNLKSWMFLIGTFTLFLFTYIKFNPVNYLRILIPTLIAASFILLTVLFSTRLNKLIKEHYSRKNKNISKEIDNIRMRQEHKDLEDKIIMDVEILSLRESLRGFKRNNFERYAIYSVILFALTLLSTFVDFGSYLSISNLVVIIILLFWGLFYFSNMISDVLIALNIVEMN